MLHVRFLSRWNSATFEGRGIRSTVSEDPLGKRPSFTLLLKASPPACRADVGVAAAGEDSLASLDQRGQTVALCPETCAPRSCTDDVRVLSPRKRKRRGVTTDAWLYRQMSAFWFSAAQTRGRLCWHGSDCVLLTQQKTVLGLVSAQKCTALLTGGNMILPCQTQSSMFYFKSEAACHLHLVGIMLIYTSIQQYNPGASVKEHLFPPSDDFYC